MRRKNFAGLHGHELLHGQPLRPVAADQLQLGKLAGGRRQRVLQWLKLGSKIGPPAAIQSYIKVEVERSVLNLENGNNTES